MAARYFLLLTAVAAFLEQGMDFPADEGTDEGMDFDSAGGFAAFFDEVVIPAKEARAKLNPPVRVGSADASKLGRECAADAMTVRILKADVKVLIIGGGPAGLSAAVYAARADLAPLVVARDGGQLESTSWVDNYPGFVDGVDAVGLIQSLEGQSKRFGATFKSCGIRQVDVTCRPFRIICEDDEVFTSSALIIATGASPRWLGAPGEAALLSRGVHTCATCDGYYYKGRPVAVVGGGDTAMEQALFLARICSQVYVLHRAGTFRASKAMATRVLNHPNIVVLWHTVVTEFSEGGDKLTALQIETQVDGAASSSTLRVDAAFVAIGHTPNTQLFQDVKRDDAGYIHTIPGTTATSVPGVYAAGDVQDPVYRQAITSAGTGAMAAMDAERWLCEHGC
ncbi:hypothetical protein M885DRAFT_613400 [Pelagophyceae sp. CCMP2097]|nr:hypothetical protein M885DRAFT_613400 [Pelagophyceae sp. CCMP2097]|mmetsp:Transcript_3795/g.13320  ORF Transcript_3795/g.13320 Transcript_3795/m.13320 type:complete len:396 (+) Transcript_3795:78-1265(+)